MYVQGKRPGERFEPLERVTLTGAGEGTISVKDSLGREYVCMPAAPDLQFTAGGALGYHTIALQDPAGHVRDSLTFSVDTDTHVDDEGGEFRDILQMLVYTMLITCSPPPSPGAEVERGAIRYRGRLYRYFVPWLRDHVHTMKGMKYFSGCLKDAIDLYRDSQRADGMIWDNVERRTPPAPGPNHWSVRFDYDGFIQPFGDHSAEFKRIPVENDVEYLFVEGLYYTWKALGDDGWMADSLDAAIRALDYSVTSPYRWSSRYGLLKRGYTIDTWDFQDEEDCLREFVGWPDPMAIHKEKTRFGIMFGDNTGYAAACRYLAEMLEHVGRAAEAQAYRQRGQEIKERLDALSWNGRYYTHHVPEDPAVRRDLGVDEASQVSLSNAYSLNRGLSHEQCVAIVQTYQDLRQHLPPGSPGEWYTIYPPLQRGFGDHNDVWQYMNGGVTPIVAGELAHGAFEHGFEGYGVDVLRRLADLGRKYDGRLHCVYTGALQPPQRTFTPLDLAPLAHADLALEGAEGLPGGRQELAGVPFLIPDLPTHDCPRCIGLSQRPGYTPQVDLPVHTKAACVYFLHTVAHTGLGGVGGTITLHYAGGTTFSQYVVVGHNVLPWSHWLHLPAPNPGHNRKVTEIAWRRSGRAPLNVQLVAYGLDNPHPDLEIERITLTAAEDGALWAVLGVTLSGSPSPAPSPRPGGGSGDHPVYFSPAPNPRPGGGSGDHPVYFEPDPVSFGIPDSWGAAAVVYALIEGLVGVVDEGVAYGQARLAPRWAAAGVGQAAAAVKYPASNGYVAYRYRHDPERRWIEIEVTGSGEACHCHVLLPAEVQAVQSVSAGDAPLPFTSTRVEGSRYVDFTLTLPGPHTVRIYYLSTTRDKSN